MRTSTMNYVLKISLAIVAVTAMSMSSLADDGPAAKEVEKTAAQIKAEKLTKKRLSRVWKTQTPVEGFESVGMFDAMENGDINVLIKTKSSAASNLMVTNNTKRPLAIQIPPAFAGVPVMRQGIGGGGGGGLGGGGGRGGGGAQGGGQGIGGGGGRGGGGGGFGGGGGGRGGGGGGGGVFNIPAGEVGKISISTVCLEHGKPNPRPRMDYKVVPIENVTSDPVVQQMIHMLANDEISQNVAQAATWNVTDGLTWDFMLTKNRIERMDGYYERYFNPNELMIAHKVVEVAKERAEELAKRAPKRDSGDQIDAEEAGK